MASFFSREDDRCAACQWMANMKSLANNAVMMRYRFASAPDQPYLSYQEEQRAYEMAKSGFEKITFPGKECCQKTEEWIDFVKKFHC